jgi:hypothetical protein
MCDGMQYKVIELVVYCVVRGGPELERSNRK